MSKAENFIKKNTRHDSNVAFDASIGYVDWLNPYQARLAVKIAREEIYEWLADHYRDYMYNPTGKKLEAFFGGDMINDLKQAVNYPRSSRIDRT